MLRGTAKSVCNIYRRVEDWHGEGDPELRGSGGPVFIEQSSSLNAADHAAVEAATMLGIERFDSLNGEMMEAPGGAAGCSAPICVARVGVPRPATGISNPTWLMTSPQC
jgi:hypothetical protein